MASISRQAIKGLVKRYGLEITDDGAAAMARIIEKKAASISKFAVRNARRQRRKEVRREDVIAYARKSGYNDA